jgi:hypothetical protein
LHLGITLVGLGRHDEALAMMEHADQDAPDGVSLVRGILAWTHALVGHETEARRILDDLHDWMRYRHVPRCTLAWTLGALGDLEGALDEYEQSVEERDAFLMYPLFPGNDPYRSHPRFRNALERLGLGWANTFSSRG